MVQEKINRINELAHKSKKEGLMTEELAEQKALREEYIAEYRANLKAQLDNTYVVGTDGVKRKLKRDKPYNGLRKQS